MFTKSRNGESQELTLHESVKFSINNSASSSAKLVKENYEKPEGSNKTMLYIALVFGLLVVIGSGYMIFKNYDEKDAKKNTEAFGYRF